MFINYCNAFKKHYEQLQISTSSFNDQLTLNDVNNNHHVDFET